MEKKLTAAQYWEWRTTISEMEIARQKALLADANLKLLHKEAEMLAVRSQLFVRTSHNDARLAYEAAQAEYQRFKKVLEDSLGMSLSNKIIDEVTFEVKDPPETNQQQSAKAEGELNGSGKTA